MKTFSEFTFTIRCVFVSDARIMNFKSFSETGADRLRTPDTDSTLSVSDRRPDSRLQFIRRYRFSRILTEMS